ncbi:DUF4271 domain-containing protein [Paraflavitalea soli]|uniref:DUF4271 domain-containing protein n=1 Tax=Paraflavitalea soli TaxID=2315862 RepID=UPI0013C523CD|nr:DUF4271 domain-containing protein [Paraflavitalea soli]
MKKIILLVFCCILLSQFSFAQTQGDSAVRQPDTAIPVPQDTPVKKDTSLRKAVVIKKKVDTGAKAVLPVLPPGRDTTSKPDTAAAVTIPIQEIKVEARSAENTLPGFQAVLRDHPYYNFKGKPRVLFLKEGGPTNTDSIFYFLFGLLFYYAIVRIFFYKYLHNITTLFFRATMRQQQLREQLSQAPLPSLFLNILFVSAGGMFLAFVARFYGIMPEQNLWLIWAYGCLLVLAIYLGKFIILKIIGWIFNVSNATDTYIFIIFMVNKMVGIFLVPVLILMAFPYGSFLPVIITLAFILLALTLTYRFIISYKPIRNEIKVSRFHFFVYLCAFEIAPLLLIYKVLLIFVERSY